MSGWFFKRIDSGRLVNWLALDSWLDSSLYGVWADSRSWWAAYSNLFGRFHISGAKRVATDLGSEFMTLGTGGLAVMLSLAIPAFEETNAAWQATGQYSITFLDRFGNEIGKRGILHDDAVPLEDVPDHVIKAVLGTEDRRFFDHMGIDFIGTARAMIENVRANDVVQGGSSISQQTAKNLFLSPERTLSRKIKEAFLAFWLEARLTKQEILKLYLDRSYMGGGAFGVEAAARFYFDKSIRDVKLAEAAMLAGLFKAPSKYAPHVNLPQSRARANEVLTNMVEAGFMTEGQVHGARLNPAKIVERREFNSPNYFLDWAFDEVQRVAAGKGDFVLTAQTTVDVTLQRAADTAITTILNQHGRSYRVKQAAMVAMEMDGAVRAIVGGADYGRSQFNRATKALRQPGSSFKPYVYLTALENGYRPTSRVVDGPVGCRVGSRYWSARNYSGGFRGAMDMQTALKKSINTVAVKLSFAVGREKVLANAKKLGLNHVKKSCSMALGDTGLTPLQHTTAYAAFASGGKSVKPYAIMEIRNSRGEVIYTHEKDGPKPKQIFERSVIEDLNFMLGQVVISGTGRRAQLDFTTAAGKTGTSSSYRDAWFMGYTGQYVTGVWFGNDNYSPTNRVTGGSLPAMAWKQFMNFAHASPNIPQIPGLELHPKQIEELNRIAALKKTDPSLGTVTHAGRAMPAQTRKVLTDIARFLKNADEIGQQSSTDPSAPPRSKKESDAKGKNRARHSQFSKHDRLTR